LVEEGLACVKAIRDRYDGERRNPWNEFECGSNYARSMASFALLPALSGFEFDLVNGHIGFDPVWTADGPFRCFWSLGSGWGVFETDRKRSRLTVLAGHLDVKTLSLPYLDEASEVRLELAGSPVTFAQSG